MALRPLTMADAPEVLALNEEVVHKLAPLDEAGYRWFLDHAALALGAELPEAPGSLAGCVVVLDPGLAYDSDNYRWFAQRYDAFAYLDRVAVAAVARRRGVASAIYDAVEGDAARRGVPLLLEVNIEPPNHASLAFHASRGFTEVGTLAHDGGKVVSLQAKHPKT